VSALVSTKTLERLARLEIGSHRAGGGRAGGDRPAGVAGTGTVFHEHRAWSPGDDLRYVDWNAWRRLGSLQVKVFELEESLDLHLLVDRSASMGEGPGSKLEAGCRAAAMIGAVALARGDTVRLRFLPHDARMPPALLVGRDRTRDLVAALAGARGGGRESFADALHEAFPELRRRAAAVLVSDFLGRSADDVRGWRRSIDFLVHRRVEATAVHVVAQEERHPRVAGPLRLRDAETGDEADVDVDAGLIAEYERRFERRLREIAAYLRGKRVRHLLLETHRAGEPDVLRALLRHGVLR
jgi:uncharacterized protein (DUF58 family)